MSEKIIEKYGIKLDAEKKSLICDGRIGRSTTDKQYVKEHKEEIIDILIKREQAEEQREKERKRKIESIEGLVELQTAITDWSLYNSAMARYIERDCTGEVPIKPEVTVEELKKKYPRAAAYVKADQWSYSSHYYKASCGRQAKEAIINGEKHEDVIADMETAWRQYTEESTD